VLLGRRGSIKICVIATRSPLVSVAVMMVEKSWCTKYGKFGNEEGWGGGNAFRGDGPCGCRILLGYILL
jgi:hypothetical protein